MTVCLDIPSLAVGWAGPDPGTDLSRRPSNGPRSFKSCSTDDMLYCDKVLRGAMLLCTGRRWRSKKSVEVAPLRIRHFYGRTVSKIFPFLFLTHVHLKSVIFVPYFTFVISFFLLCSITSCWASRVGFSNQCEKSFFYNWILTWQCIRHRREPSEVGCTSS